MKFCPECGNEVEGMKFCPECGYKLNGTTVQTVTPATQSAAPESNGDENVILTFQNKSIVGDTNAKKKLIGNLDVKVPHRNYILTTHRFIVEEHGVLKTSRDEIDLYRISDVQIKQGIVEKTRNIGTITILSSDQSLPNCTLSAIEDPQKVAETIKLAVRKAKEKMNISYRHIIE